MSDLIVIDANITLAQIIPLAYSQLVERRMQDWHLDQVQIVVPVLWKYEVISGLRKAVARGLMSQEMAFAAVGTIEMMNYHLVGPSPPRDLKALAWAAALEQGNAYDSQYLALAEDLPAPFWTADRRLANSMLQMGAGWVHWVGEELVPDQ